MTIEPPFPASIIAGTAARMVRQVPDRFTPITLSHSSSGHFEEPAPAEHTGVCDHHVEAPELCLRHRQ